MVRAKSASKQGDAEQKRRRVDTDIAAAPAVPAGPLTGAAVAQPPSAKAAPAANAPPAGAGVEEAVSASAPVAPAALPEGVAGQAAVPGLAALPDPATNVESAAIGVAEGVSAAEPVSGAVGKSVVSSSEPVAGAAASAAEAEPLARAGVSHAPMLVCEAASQVLSKHSKGIRRIPLDELGISPYNRRVNGKYVHNLGRRIVSVEGFVRMRYRHGWCHEPNPFDDLAVARFTNAAARGSGFLAPVPMKPLFGSFAKSHLLSFLQALKSGQVYWNDTKELMLPPPASAELAEHLQHGMFYEVLSWEATQDNAAALQALIAADNFDAGFALGQTEMHLLVHLRSAIVLARPPPGQSVLDVVRSQVLQTSGQHWEEGDIVAFYQCAKSLGEEHLQFLAEIVDTHVAVDRVAVRPSDFAAAAVLPPSVPWLKVALLATQYMSPPERRKPGPRGRSFGSSIEKTTWERLKKATAAVLEPAEAFLRTILDRYSLEKVAGVSRQQWGRDIPALFVKVATQVVLAKDLGQVASNFGRIELRLRESFGRSMPNLPAPINHGGSCGEAAKIHGASCGGKSTEGVSGPPQEAPPLNFVEGKLVADFAATAQGAGLIPGAAVRCVVAHPGVEVGMVGVVDRMTAERLFVRWQIVRGDKSCLPCDNLDHLACEVTPTARAGVAKKPSPAEVRQQQAVAEAVAEAEARLSLPSGNPWIASAPQDSETGVAAIVTSLLWQLHQAHQVYSDQLIWSKCPISQALFCTAKEKFKAGRLVLIPWPAKVYARQPAELPRGQFCMSIDLKFSTSSSPVFLVGPRLREGSEAAETPSGPVEVRFPFWDIVEASPRNGLALTLEHEWVDMPLHAYQPGKGLFVRKGQLKKTLQVRIPFWTNPVDVQVGQRLFVDGSALPVQGKSEEST